MPIVSQIRTGLTATVLTLVVLMLLPTSVTAADWYGDGAKRLQAWIARNGPNAGPEAAHTIGTTQSVLSHHGLDSAVAFIVPELNLLEGDLEPQAFANLELILGQVYVFELERYSEAEVLLEKARAGFGGDAVEGTTVSERWFEATAALAASHFWQFESEDALRVAQAGHRAAIDSGDAEHQRIFSRWIGRALEIEQAYSDAILYYQRALELAEGSGDEESLFDAQVDLAVATFKSDDAANGLKLLQPAFAYARERDDLLGLALLWEGSMLRELGRFAEARKVLSRSVEIVDRLQQRNRQVHVRFELARAYCAQGDYEEVIPLVAAARELTADKRTAYQDLMEFELLAEAYAGMGKFQQAYVNLAELVDVRYQLDSTNNDQNIQELTKRYESQRQQQTIAEQRAELANRRWLYLTIAAIASLAVFLIVALVYVWRSRRLSSAQQVTIERQAQRLREQ